MSIRELILTRRSRYKWKVLSAILLCGAGAPAAEFYVAPDGDDAAPGTKERPAATLARARDLVRAANARERAPVTVFLRGGTYSIAEPVVFGPEDSGTESCPVTYAAYPGEKPVVSGGKKISGWKRGADGVWIAEIPGVKEGKWYFRQLHVGGARRPRARLPQAGLRKVAGPAEPARRAFGFNPGEIDPGWRNLTDVEIVVLQFWSEARERIEAVDAAARTVRFTGDCFRPPTWSLGWYAENVFEGLAAPGQWYLDRSTGTLHYRPLPGEDPDRIEAVAPVAAGWLRFDGDAAAGRYVEHIVFRGISFRHSAWSLGQRLGYSYPQASIDLTPQKPLWVGWQVDEGTSTDQSQVPVPAAIHARGARRLRFEENDIAATGAWAIWFAPGGCRDNAVAENRFADIGAGAVRIGGPDTTSDDRQVTGGTAVTDNVIHDCAQVYFGAPAIYVGQSSANRIAHNEISGACEWAVSVGWNWGYMPPNDARDNVVEQNHCHHLGTGALGMHGALYFLGVQPGTAARNNLIHDVAGGGSGIVLDNSSVGIVVERNVVHHVAVSALLFNFNDLGNIVQNNVLAFAGESLMNRSGDAGKLDQTGVFYRNVFCWDGAASRLFQPDKWANFDIIMDHNLYWDASGKPPRLLGLGFEEWRKKGLDASSIVADPCFVDPARGDFSLRPESPAFRLGFRAIDLREVGPRPPVRR